MFVLEGTDRGFKIYGRTRGCFALARIIENHQKAPFRSKTQLFADFNEYPVVRSLVYQKIRSLRLEKKAAPLKCLLRKAG